MTAKPFLPIDDQVRLLGQRGLAVDANTARILMCEATTQLSTVIKIRSLIRA